MNKNNEQHLPTVVIATGVMNAGGTETLIMEMLRHRTRRIRYVIRFENPDDLFPTIYRVDRINSFKVLDEHFKVPYRNRFEEGEFRKRVQFMYGGKLQTVRFTYTGPSVEAVLDRLPTAEIVGERDGEYEIRAEVFGKGIEAWLRSQGAYVQMKNPK